MPGRSLAAAQQSSLNQVHCTYIFNQLRSEIKTNLFVPYSKPKILFASAAAARAQNESIIS